jgi:hypothetical protein
MGLFSPEVKDETGRDLYTVSVSELRDSASKRGYLTKQGKIIRNWKRRLFVLTPKYLFYFKDEAASSAQGVLRIADVHTVKSVDVDAGESGPFTFQVTTPERVYLLQADNRDEMNDWVRALGRALVMASNVRQDDDMGYTG